MTEEAFEAECQKGSRPYDGLAPFAEPYQQQAARLLTTATTLERGYQALLGSGNRQVVQPQVREMDRLHQRWLSDLERILLANSTLERIAFEVVIERESDVGLVDRLGVMPILDLRRIAMSLQLREIPPVPEDTQRVAWAALPKDNVNVRLRDEIGTIFDDPLFAPWFPTRSQPAESPWRLASIMEYAQ